MIGASLSLRLAGGAASALLLLAAAGCGAPAAGDDKTGDGGEIILFPNGDAVLLADTGATDSWRWNDIAAPRVELQGEQELTKQELPTPPDLVLPDLSGEIGGADGPGETDGGSTVAGPQPQIVLSAGGGVLASPGYRLRLWVAPALPLGEAASPNYRFKLGPVNQWGAK